jgi:hypothetical protein
MRNLGLMDKVNRNSKLEMFGQSVSSCRPRKLGLEFRLIEKIA